MTVVRIRGGSGLGDALYVQSITRHLIEKGNDVEACSNFPEVFRPLNGRCIASPFRRHNIDRIAHYSLRRGHQTDQFRDCCLQAGIAEHVDLRLDWMADNVGLIDRVRSIVRGRPIVIIQMPRAPMNRRDGYAAELLPDCRAMQKIIDRCAEIACTIQVGHGEALHRFDRIELDLANATSVSDLLDVASIADVYLGYVSFLLPLAESLGKPALMVWSRRGLQSQNIVINRLTPQKVIHRHDLVSAVLDDCCSDDLTKAANAVLAKIRSPAMV